MSPLDGVLVLDFSTLLPGPMASLLLAEAGAEVIKIERPGQGDDMRGYDPKWGGDSVNFALLNRGKESLALDLKNDADRLLLAPLIARADVVIEQFRPGVMDRLGLGYETIAAANPRAIYCSITGYGQTGPRRSQAGHDLNYIAETGLLNLSMGSAAEPVIPPALIADIAGGAYPAVLNILLALRERDLTGQGRHLDISMTDNLFPLMYWALGEGQSTGQWPGNGDSLVTGASPRYRLYPAADGRMIAAAPLEQKFWETFCDVIGLEPALRDDQRDPGRTVGRVAEIIASKAGHVWQAAFAGRDCCCSVVASLEEALQDQHFIDRGILSKRISNPAGEEISALPVPIAEAFRAGGPARAAPPLGESNPWLTRRQGG